MGMYIENIKLKDKINSYIQNGYVRIRLNIFGRKRTVALHILLVLKYIPNPLNLPELE